MKDALVVSALSVVPQHAASRLLGWFARLRLPRRVQAALVRAYARHYRVEMADFEGEVEDYPTLLDFFVRPLRPGARPVEADPDVVVSPVDGRLQAAGALRGDLLEQAPGRAVSATALIDPVGAGDLPVDPARFRDGAYAVLYLSPRDYHRIHAPADARVLGWAYRPGRLWPVFPAAVRRVPGLLARNERLVLALDTPFGPAAMVCVGAFGVGRIACPLLPDPRPRRAGGGPLEPPAEVARGEEVGRFELGSTVVLLFPPGAVEWTLPAGSAVRMGRGIARRVAQTIRPDIR